MIRTTRQAVVQQFLVHAPYHNIPVRVLIDLMTLPKTGKFRNLSTPTGDSKSTEGWVRMLNGKRGLHLLVLYLVLASYRVPWSFRLWRGKGQFSPTQLTCKLLSTVPKSLVKGRTVIIQADTEFGTIEFLNAVRQKSWRAVIGVRCNRKL